MNRRKQNISRWALPLLLALLVVGCLVASTGGALARYRVDRKEEITFEVRPPEQIYLGQMVTQNGAVSFDPAAQGNWEMAEGKQQLTFTIANGTGEKAFSGQDQQVHLRLVGTLGIWNGSDKLKLTLEVPSEDDPEKMETYEATVTRIREGSPMYATFGDGWVFAFFDENGEELTWLLEGGSFAHLTLTMTLEGAAPGEAGLLQLQISSVSTEK
jgi:hypothetical protein